MWIETAGNTQNVLSTQITLGLVGAGLLQYLKNNPRLSKFNLHSAKLNHLVLVATSAIGAVGIHTVWSAAGHSLTITGLDLATILPAFWLWSKQWAVQYLIHRGLFGPVAVAPAPLISGSVALPNPAPASPQPSK